MLVQTGPEWEPRFARDYALQQQLGALIHPGTLSAKFYQRVITAT